MHPTTLICPAPAKLNLFLRVIGRREDGYHLLETVFRFIDFSDTLSFTLREDDKICRVNEVAGVAQEQDLCIRAARLLQRTCNCSIGVDLTIEKRIPMGGGLGGGSSDAATTLLALNHLWNLGLSRERLRQLGLTLGADVPVFVFGENAYAEGIGEQLQACSLPDAWYLVLFPPVHVATAQIFARLNLDKGELTRNPNSLTIRALPLAHGLDSGQRVNDLQAAVCSLYPEVERHLVWLGQFSPALMTGSGACVFAEFETERQALSIFNQLPEDMRGIVARGLTEHPLRNI